MYMTSTNITRVRRIDKQDAVDFETKGKQERKQEYILRSDDQKLRLITQTLQKKRPFQVNYLIHGTHITPNIFSSNV